MTRWFFHFCGEIIKARYDILTSLYRTEKEETNERKKDRHDD